MAEEARIEIATTPSSAAIRGPPPGWTRPPGRDHGGRGGRSPRTARWSSWEAIRIADKVRVITVVKTSAFSDVDVVDPRALGALYAMLRGSSTRHPRLRGVRGLTTAPTRPAPKYDAGDWHAFEDHAIETKAEADDLMDIVTKTIG